MSHSPGGSQSSLFWFLLPRVARSCLLHFSASYWLYQTTYVRIWDHRRLYAVPSIFSGGNAVLQEHAEKVKHYCLGWTEQQRQSHTPDFGPLEQVCAVKVSSEEVRVCPLDVRCGCGRSCAQYIRSSFRSTEYIGIRVAAHIANMCLFYVYARNAKTNNLLCAPQNEEMVQPFSTLDCEK